MYVNSFILAYFLLLSITSLTSALQAKFTPSDDSEQLPLSAAYRDALRKLCDVFRSGGNLPAEYANKKEVLGRMCKRLEADDSNISHKEISFFNSKALVISLGGASIALLLLQRDTITKFAKSVAKRFFPKRGIKLNSAGNQNSKLDSSEDINKLIREARLRRLAEQQHSESTKNE